jgi:aspartate-semialdehyde dehydrogenase
MPVETAVVGADRHVGRRLVRSLLAHEEFELSVVTRADERGRIAVAAGSRRETEGDGPMPDKHSGGADGGDTLPASVTAPAVTPSALAADPTALPAVDLVFSTLPDAVAERVEPELATAGHVVVSTATNARLERDVPLVTPELNPEQVGLIEVQREERGWDGAILKHPGAPAVLAALPLAPVAEFGLDQVHVTTFRPAAGGDPPAMETLDNVVPHVRGGESRLRTELQKLLGEFDGTRVSPHPVDVSVASHRVPVRDACLESVWLQTDESVSPVDIESAFRSAPTVALPSAPTESVTVSLDPSRPQPRLDTSAGDGQTVVTGPVDDAGDGVQFDCLVHEAVRGGAGGALLVAELLARDGYV